MKTRSRRWRAWRSSASTAPYRSRPTPSICRKRYGSACPMLRHQSRCPGRHFAGNSFHRGLRDKWGSAWWCFSGETGIGIAAYLHLIAATPWVTEPGQCILHWQTDDVIEEGPFNPKNNIVRVPEGSGLGVTLSAERLKRGHERYLQEGAYNYFRDPVIPRPIPSPSIATDPRSKNRQGSAPMTSKKILGPASLRFCRRRPKTTAKPSTRARLLEEIDFQIENGVDGVCIFGSTGGNGSFTDEEMKNNRRCGKARCRPHIGRGRYGRANDDRLHCTFQACARRRMRRHHDLAGVVLAADPGRSVRSLRDAWPAP